MALSREQRLEGLAGRIAELRLWLAREWADLGEWTFDGRPLAPGAAWPERRGVHRLEHPEIAPPDGERILALDLGGEGVVRIRYAGGEHESFGLDAEHRSFPLRAEPFSLAVEIVARLPFGAPNRESRLASARMVRMDAELERLVRLLELVLEAAHELGGHEVTDPLLEAAARALRASVAERHLPVRLPAGGHRATAQRLGAAG